MPVQRRKRASVAGKKSTVSRRKAVAKPSRTQSQGQGLSSTASNRRGRKVSARKGGLVKRIASAMSR